MVNAQMDLQIARAEASKTSLVMVLFLSLLLFFTQECCLRLHKRINWKLIMSDGEMIMRSFAKD